MARNSSGDLYRQNNQKSYQYLGIKKKIRSPQRNRQKIKINKEVLHKKLNTNCSQTSESHSTSFASIE